MWLRNHRIPVSYDDAFNYSKKELTKEVSRISEEMNVWDGKKKEYEKTKAKLQLTMNKLREEAEDSDNTESKLNDLRAKLMQQDNEFREEVQGYLDAQNKFKELQNVRWLLENILSKTFTDPQRLTDPPIVPEITWRDIFDDLPEIDQIDEDYMKEIDDYFGINQSKASEESEDSSA